MQENMIIIFLTFTGVVLYLLMANKFINALRTVKYLAASSTIYQLSTAKAAGAAKKTFQCWPPSEGLFNFL